MVLIHFGEIHIISSTKSSHIHKMKNQIFKAFTPKLKEVRIHLCPQSSPSNGVRKFVENYYLGVKEKNPNLPILIRECTGVEPKMWLRFEHGKESGASLKNLNEDQIASLLHSKVIG